MLVQRTSGDGQGHVADGMAAVGMAGGAALQFPFSESLA